MFKKIKSLFIIEEDVAEAGTSGRKGKDPKPGIEKDEVEKVEMSGGAVSKSSLDKFLKVLADVMETANIEGYDYLEYKAAVRSLDHLEMDEEKRFITSYTMARTMGAEKESLKKSASFYLEVLKREETKFNESLKNQIETRVKSKKQSLELLKEKVAKKEEQIRKLQEEITAIETKSGEVQQQMEDATKKLASVQKSFASAYDLIVNQIKQDLNKIDQYLK
jgi:chromosome segregation ATPase